MRHGLAERALEMSTGPTGGAPDYLAVNLANWDERVAAHVASPGYAVQRFLDDPAYLSDVVTFDLPRLGDISGLRGERCAEFLKGLARGGIAVGTVDHQ